MYPSWLGSGLALAHGGQHERRETIGYERTQTQLHWCEQGRANNALSADGREFRANLSPLRANSNKHGYQCVPLSWREFFIDNQLVRIHFIIEMVWWTGLAPSEFELSFPGSRISASIVFSLLLLSASPQRLPVPLPNANKHSYPCVPLPHSSKHWSILRRVWGAAFKRIASASPSQCLACCNCQSSQFPSTAICGSHGSHSTSSNP